jgi:predicted metallopeptidase
MKTDMFTVSVRQLDVLPINTLAKLVGGRNNHFTITLNSQRWGELRQRERIEVLIHEMGHIATQYLNSMNVLNVKDLKDMTAQEVYDHLKDVS